MTPPANVDDPQSSRFDDDPERRRELILYATPDGALGRACERFFASASAAGRATTAQTYPPHVSLTGFFRRPGSAVGRVIRETQAAMRANPTGEVSVVALRAHDDWLGLEVASEWLLGVAAAFASNHLVELGDDPIRLKDWLHLSLAYGDVPAGLCVADYADEAAAVVDVEAPATWSVGLWERRGDRWVRHC